MRQWMLRITEYAEQLLEGLDDLDWPESTKEMQRNWIGRSIGADIEFELEGLDEKLQVFTTRAGTIFGATYMVLDPEHHLVYQLTTGQYLKEVDLYRERIARNVELERQEHHNTKYEF